MRDNSASRHASAATGLRYSFQKPVRRSEIPSHATSDIGSCHHRIVEVTSRNVFADRTAHFQHVIQVRMQAQREYFMNPVVAQPLENFAGKSLGFVRVGTRSRAADGAQAGLYFG